MKNLKILLMLLLITATGGRSRLLFGQDGPSINRFKSEKIAYFNEKLNLTQEVADKFWPVYEDLHNRRMKINEDEKSLLSYVISNSENLTEKETDESIEKYMKIQDKRLELDKQYHDKFTSILGKKKTLQLYALEREFRLHLLRKFQSHDGHGRGGHYRGNPK
jgi:hypothetical protein